MHASDTFTSLAGGSRNNLARLLKGVNPQVTSTPSVTTAAGSWTVVSGGTNFKSISAGSASNLRAVSAMGSYYRGTVSAGLTMHTSNVTIAQSSIGSDGAWWAAGPISRAAFPGVQPPFSS